MSSWCPQCQKVQPMNATTAEVEGKNEKDEPVKILVTNYHCNGCHCFVYSRETRINVPAEA